ncbi:AAA family ATPase [Phototrophicus methaneseepsis]|uniref:AAA family ATPase n=1 Tax=Phototrophicus methaneseepsis TaxID=2710758 RepID=A0A7S8EBN4_9CHLR|nr:UvrD-helicase domain-containing protein [Phototrophicus methaneseepsis]QPC84007.1 AAA family ATPase [Phototrophicus methaneseepsis]
MYLLKDQQRVAKENTQTTIFLEGMAGTGKSTAAIERAKHLIREGTRADSILILVPQATLALPYKEALRRARIAADTNVQTATLGKLAYEMVDLFWPLIAEDVGFTNPFERPHFLSLELVQYYMTRFLAPEIDANDYFNSVHISRNRLYTQLVDNLNKAALVGFPHESIGERLKSAYRGDVEQKYIYDDAQVCASLFREMCRQHNLLDFSLQVVLFANFLWPKPEVQRYLTQTYRHLIVDNIEEDTPVTHDILADWLPQCESAVVIYDTQGGYRRFLGADPTSAERLKALCEVHITLDNHRVMSPDMEALQSEIALSLNKPLDDAGSGSPIEALVYNDHTYHPQMIDWVTEHIASLVHQEGVLPNEIVILAPYLPDALRFSLQTRLDALDVPHRSHRPSRALREESASRTLLTLAKLAHPQWGISSSKFDVAYTLTACIHDLDLVRARLLTDVLYKNGKLASFESIKNDHMQGRITFELGLRYDTLIHWLEAYEQETPLPLDIFMSKLFGEVLSQPGFGFHNRLDDANVAANLIDSAREFRQTVSKIEPDLDVAVEYVRMVDNGVIANQYIRDWAGDKDDAVLIAPAYTFLLTNQPVDYQFWLNVGSSGWSQRLYQPLTQPYVLSRQWPQGRVWTDQDEVEADEQTLYDLSLGLIRRCRKKIYLGLSQFNEQGYEQRGPLLMTIQAMLRRLQRGAQQHV